MQKDFLQSLKLEISKTFKLVAYERIAFHKILGILKNESGMKILLRDIKNSSELVRKSAISTIKNFNFPEITKELFGLLEEKITNEEIFHIFDHLDMFGNVEYEQGLIDYIGKYIEKTDYIKYLTRAITVLGNIGKDSEVSQQYLKSIIENNESFEKLRCSAIEIINVNDDIQFYESLLKEDNDKISYTVYRTLARIIDERNVKIDDEKTDDLFTKKPDQEDRYILQVRVLLGKMTVRFEAYSNEVKSAFILAMISTGHREFIVYTMKAMTSDDPDLIDKTLFVILDNIENLTSADKLFRSLIALPSVTKRDNTIIVDIFTKYFTQIKDKRSEVLIRDKIYNYIVVMLDSYFETYRKDFMIPEIMEKGYPKEFQLIRRFILRRFNPDLKLKILRYFNTEDTTLKSLLYEISEKVPYTSDDDQTALESFVDILWEKDKKIREISASRIHDIDFEKRYLRNKIIRLCQIIGRLRIEEASANLVKIFNYVKKYYDQDIYNSVTYTLSLLNYPYMLGELEVLLFSGNLNEKKWAVKLLSLFSDQRSLNIMLDFLRDNHKSDSDLVQKILRIVVKRDVSNNVAANEVAKEILDDNSDSDIRKYAIILIGCCGNESDIEILNELFQSLESVIEKEAIVHAISVIIGMNDSYNKTQVLSYLKEYLKDSGIKIRIFASATLLKMGDKDVLHSIREMMIIKNQQIQREVLMIIGEYMSLDLAYFLVSLLRDEYAISQDIIPLIKMLKEEDLKEIDHFIVNLFKKYEGASFDFDYGVRKSAQKSDDQKIKYFSKKEVIVLKIEILDYFKIEKLARENQIILDFNKYYKTILENIIENKGIISSSTGGKIIAYFPSAQPAGMVGLDVIGLTRQYNYTLKDEDHIHVSIYADILEKDIVNNELIISSDVEMDIVKKAPVADRVIVNSFLADLLAHSYKCVPFPESIFYSKGYEVTFRELETPLNFLVLAEEVVRKIENEEKRRVDIEKQIEEGVKNQVIERRSPSAIAYAKAMDEIGKILKKELASIHKYVSNRSTDRELIKTVEKMLTQTNKRYMHETSKIMID